MQIDVPNFWALICDINDLNAYNFLKNLSICLVVLIIGIGLALIILKRVDLSNGRMLLLSSLWTVFTCFMFLPSMHERYGYLLDILAIVYAAVSAKYIWLAVVCQLVSLRGYCVYLFQYEMLDIKLTALIYTAVYVYVSYLFLKDVILNGAKLSEGTAITKAIK